MKTLDARPELNSRALDPSTLSGIGALLAALFSSACCWLPLLLIGVGASSVGVAGFFEAYRPHFLAGAVILLGAGFYFVYLRKPRCGPDGSCEVPNVKLQRFNKIVIWLAAAAVAVFALFPNYVGYFFGSNEAQAEVQMTAAPGREYRIEGMTCEGCAGLIRSQLVKTPGVLRAEVSYESKTARVFFIPGQTVPGDQIIVESIKRAGYRGIPVKAGS